MLSCLISAISISKAPYNGQAYNIYTVILNETKLPNNLNNMESMKILNPILPHIQCDTSYIIIANFANEH